MKEPIFFAILLASTEQLIQFTESEDSEIREFAKYKLAQQGDLLPDNFLEDII